MALRTQRFLTTGLMHTQTHRLWQPAQDLHGVKPNGVPVLRGGSRHGLPFLIKKQSVMNDGFPSEVSLGVPATLHGRPNTQ